MSSSNCFVRLFGILFCLFGGGTKTPPPPATISIYELYHITLVAGQNTTTFHELPRPQLNCIAGYCEQQYISSVSCTKYSISQEGALNWNCNESGDLSVWYNFRMKNITCERYPGPKDTNIIVGSCSLDYEIELEKGLIFIIIFCFMFIIGFVIIGCKDVSKEEKSGKANHKKKKEDSESDSGMFTAMLLASHAY